MESELQCKEVCSTCHIPVSSSYLSLGDQLAIRRASPWDRLGCTAEKRLQIFWL